ncbi:MAG: GNAT family N-acetyltransferase [Oceanobacter sp.]
MSLTTRLISGTQLSGYFDELAALRIKVFREYPYLYDGTLEYEANYLETYFQSEQAMAIIAFYEDRNGGTGNDERIVGASTGVPMNHESLEFRQPFEQQGIDTSQVFYCGESILLPEYRGKGLYRRFFKGRENYAREQGFTQTAFCAVVRSEQHPLKPTNYQPLDKVWKHFGYKPKTGLTTNYDWKDIDQPETRSHEMQFWLKNLEG